MPLAQSIARCVIAREGGDSYHSAEVGDLAGRVARRLRCAPEDVQRVRAWPGWLHDVGKSRSRTPCCRKPGPLTEDEWAVMRGHAAAGEASSAQIPELAALAPAVRHHHERWDGGGYPDGLGGEDIPLAARIVAVADALDAMTSDRVYRKALAPAEALTELRRVAGSQLDPFVVEALCVELAANSPEPLRLPYHRNALVERALTIAARMLASNASSSSESPISWSAWHRAEAAYQRVELLTRRFGIAEVRERLCVEWQQRAIHGPSFVSLGASSRHVTPLVRGVVRNRGIRRAYASPSASYSRRKPSNRRRWPSSSRRIAITMSFVTGSTPSVNSMIRVVVLDRAGLGLDHALDHVDDVGLLLGRLEVGLLGREVHRARHDAVELLDPVGELLGVAELLLDVLP